tara:strand:- start:601 stop:1536 length:936 start_codon:yes stop_codon:yes gene_type:complete
MHKVLISDSMDEIAEKILKSHNIEVDVITNYSSNELLNNISKYNGLIVRSATKVTSEIINAATNLKIIGRAGAGVDNIDVDYAKNKKIIVMNTPGGNTNATAEHTIGLIFSLLRKIPIANESTHKGLWEKKKLKGNELKGKNIGIIGFGNVGSRVAEISHALGMNVLIYSSHFNSIKNEFKNYKSSDLNTIISNSDIISFHCKPNKDGSSILSINELKLMKPSSIVINTARGNLIDENDLKQALEEKIIKGAALDVFQDEPVTQHPLLNVKNIVLTPHIAASTDEAQIIVAEMIANQFCDYFNNNKIINSL